MNAKCFLLPVLFALCCVGACSQSTEMPVAHEAAPEEKPLGEVPQAPAPHVKKPTAERLVGTWRMIAVDNKPLPLSDSRIYAEFTKDGKFTFMVDEPPSRVQYANGTYRLTDRTITVSADATAREPARSWDIVIETLSETELSTLAGPEKSRERSTFIRIVAKEKP